MKCETNILKALINLDNTYLRIRGMWGMDNPLNAFNYIEEINYNKEVNLQVYTLIPKEKYYSLPKDDLELIEESSLQIDDVEIKSPNNTNEFIETKLISKSYSNF